MEMTGQSYSSGEWLVREGSEEEFIQTWTTFTEWSLDNAPGAKSFVLVRSVEEPRKFLSLGAWESQQAQERWREMAPDAGDSWPVPGAVRRVRHPPIHLGC